MTLEWLEISPADPATNVGNIIQLTATAHFSDGTSQDVTSDMFTNWSSNNQVVATVGNGGFGPGAKPKGQVTGVSTGTAIITAQYQPPGSGQVSGNTTVTVQ